MTDGELIAAATSVIRRRTVGGYLIGDVGAALVTASGALHLGICIEASSGMGFCAEASAIGAMVTAGESRIARIVAVWQDEAGLARVIPPCGRCREFLKAVDAGNLATEVLLPGGRIATLADLLPHHDWFAPAG